MSAPGYDLDGINLSQNEFWELPPTQRHAGFARLRSLREPPFFLDPETPLTTPGEGYYALVRYEDVLAASRQPELFSSGRGATSIQDLPADFNEYFGSMINMDDPRHARLRRIVSRAFTPKMIKKFHDDVQRTATAIVDDLLASGSCDFVEKVAARLPLQTICEMMGIAHEHYTMVLGNTNIILSGADPEFISQDMDMAITQILTAGKELADLVMELAAARKERPADDLISALANANIDGEQLTPAELASFFILLVVAGNETTRTAISQSLILLTEYPRQRELLLADVDGTVDRAVEEIIRFTSPVIWMRRSVSADCVLNGHTFRKGDKTLLFYWSANRDEAIFETPGRFDILRYPNPHLGFGGAGPHFCLGAHLARREISTMLRELLARAPGIRAVGEPDRLLSSFINGIKHLQCELD
jgi:cytochrome P450